IVRCTVTPAPSGTATAGINRVALTAVFIIFSFPVKNRYDVFAGSIIMVAIARINSHHKK
ncbi:hypothetical protein, partial [Nitrosomonas sp.]|uniref:hypothetical protein n=1 Tax=Nitrosomonas sp. TaxID=42353 RepID=UPI00273066C0